MALFLFCALWFYTSAASRNTINLSSKSTVSHFWGTLVRLLYIRRFQRCRVFAVSRGGQFKTIQSGFYWWYLTRCQKFRFKMFTLFLISWTVLIFQSLCFIEPRVVFAILSLSNLSSVSFLDWFVFINLADKWLVNYPTNFAKNLIIEHSVSGHLQVC